MDICDIKEYRANQLMLMHNAILDRHNDDIYGDWVLLLCSESHDVNFNSVAENEGFYNECCNLFNDLISDAGY